MTIIERHSYIGKQPDKSYAENRASNMQKGRTGITPSPRKFVFKRLFLLPLSMDFSSIKLRLFHVRSPRQRRTRIDANERQGRLHGQRSSEHTDHRKPRRAQWRGRPCHRMAADSRSTHEPLRQQASEHHDHANGTRRRCKPHCTHVFSRHRHRPGWRRHRARMRTRAYATPSKRTACLRTSSLWQWK